VPWLKMKLIKTFLIFQRHRQSEGTENESLAKDLQITPDQSEDERLSGMYKDMSDCQNYMLPSCFLKEDLSNDHLSPQIIEHNKDFDILHWKIHIMAWDRH
jgi:hypothetical protein